jgi:hypothetical protein
MSERTILSEKLEDNQEAAEWGRKQAELMKKGEEITTEQADADLRGVYEYIAFELLSPDNAAGQLDRLEEHIIGLENFPEKFRVYGKDVVQQRTSSYAC